MMRFFTKNLDTMKEATNKKGKGLSNLENVNRLQKDRMSEYFGGDDTQNVDSKKRGFLGRLFGPKPCDGDLPQ